jgi:hypothetical protein
MRCFEEGLREEFFRLYERYMPQQYRVVDADAQKVEFWLQIYFAVFPALPGSAGKKGAALAEGLSAPRAPGANLAAGMAKLRTFIETSGRDVARTEEFLPFYALPYVPQPQYHPAFMSLFEPRWTMQLRAMVEAFLANAPDEMPAPRILTILRHYYGLVDAATNDSGMAKLADGRDAALQRYAAPQGRGGGGGGRGPSRAAGSPVKVQSYQVLPRPVSSSGAGGGYYSMLGSPGAGVRGVTPLLEGIASLHDLIPTPDLTDMGDEYYDELDSLAAQIAALDPTKAPKSPAKPPKLPAEGTATERAAAAAAAAAHAPPDVPPVDVAVISRAMSADVKSRAAKAGLMGGMGQQQGEYTFDDLLSNGQGPPVIAAPTVHYMSGGGLETHRGGGGGASEREKMRVRRVMTPYRDVVFAPLDYDKIRLELRGDVAAAGGAGANQKEAKEAEGRVGRLLQSLCWRVARSAPGHPCRDAAQTLVDGDILALRVADAGGTESTPASLVDSLVGCGGRVRGECLRLVNVLALDGGGRRYLLSPGSRVVAALSAAIEPGEGDTQARRHLLGALQKLSLHRRAARRMVALGLVPWIARVLQGAASTSGTARKSREGLEPLSEFNAEYGAALLMNLSLLPQGKKAAERMLRGGGGAGGGGDADKEEEDILEVMSLLLQSNNPQVRTYANGTLYSLLQRETIREAARELGFEDLLADLAAHSDPVFVRQLTYIIALLASNGPGTAAAGEPAGGAPDDDAAAPFPGYSQFDPEAFNAVEDGAWSGLQEEEPVEEGEGAGAGAEEGEEEGLMGLLATGRLGLVGEELLREAYLVDDEAPEEGGSLDGTGFGRETLGPDDDDEDFLPRDDEEPAAPAAAEEAAVAPAAEAPAAEAAAEAAPAAEEAAVVEEAAPAAGETAAAPAAPAVDGDDAAVPPAEGK